MHIPGLQSCLSRAANCLTGDLTQFWGHENQAVALFGLRRHHKYHSSLMKTDATSSQTSSDTPGMSTL